MTNFDFVIFIMILGSLSLIIAVFLFVEAISYKWKEKSVFIKSALIIQSVNWIFGYFASVGQVLDVFNRVIIPTDSMIFNFYIRLMPLFISIFYIKHVNSLKNNEEK